MDNEEITGVKFSQFPSATPGDSDEVVGLHSEDNARFSVANFILAIRQGLANIFVPLTRTINNKALSNDISLNASDVGAVATSAVGAVNGVASLDSNGKVPGAQLDLSNKQSTITASGILKGDGAGGVTAAVAGTDYATPAQLADKANQSQLAYVESGTTASQNYTAGQYISLNGVLYTADTAIASGATFYTSGGNKNLTECVGGGLNNVFNVKNPALTVTPATGVTVNAAFSSRIGNLIQCVIEVRLISSKAIWNPIVTVDKKPANYGPVTVYTGTYVPSSVAMFINPDNGNIQAGANINAGTYTIYGFYITNDP